MEKYISIGKAAYLLGISLSTMYRWLKYGKITATFRTFGNHRRFLFSDISKISKSNEKNNDHKPSLNNYKKLILDLFLYYHGAAAPLCLQV